uniref:C-type lectin domain-containing protein n=1 Tax=Anopheles farauti TaxID=69004 RepID=A0A182QVR0_9DIPT
MFLVTFIQNRTELDAIIEHIAESEDWNAEQMADSISRKTFVIFTAMLLKVAMLGTFFVFTVKAIAEEEVKFGIARGKTYHFVSSFQLSWQKAIEYCRDQDMFLVSIRNQEQLDAIGNEIEKSGFWKTHDYINMWTSLNDIGEEGQFYWASTGERLTFNLWKAGEPNNAKLNECTDEDCVVLVHHKDGGIVYKYDDRVCLKLFASTVCARCNPKRIFLQLSWHKAFEYCRSIGMFLVSIDSREQLEEIVSVLTKSGYWQTRRTLAMWTSLNDIGEEGQYYWASTGERLTYDRWRTDEPNNVQHNDCTDEDCVMLLHCTKGSVNFSFDDRPCQYEAMFMCETLSA